MLYKIKDRTEPILIDFPIGTYEFHMAPKDVPENSRVFVVCSQGVTEETIRDTFGEYGLIEDVWFIKPKRQSSENTSNVCIVARFNP